VAANDNDDDDDDNDFLRDPLLVFLPSYRSACSASFALYTLSSRSAMITTEFEVTEKGMKRAEGEDGGRRHRVDRHWKEHEARRDTSQLLLSFFLGLCLCFAVAVADSLVAAASLCFFSLSCFGFGFCFSLHFCCCCCCCCNCCCKCCCCCFNWQS
jgi:hypothetical protein